MTHLIIRGVHLAASLALGLILLGSMAYAEKYIVTMKDEQAFTKVYQQINRGTVSSSADGNIYMMGVLVQEVKSLKNLGMFIVESDDRALAMEKNPGVYSVKKDVIFQGVDPVFNDGLSPMRRMIDSIFSDSGDVEVPDENQAPPPPPPLLELTWGQKAIHVTGAWKHTRGEGAKVLVMDTGIDKDHPGVSK